MSHDPRIKHASLASATLAIALLLSGMALGLGIHDRFVVTPEPSCLSRAPMIARGEEVDKP